MKKVLSFVMSVMLLLLLAGCGETKSTPNLTEDTQVTRSETTTEKPTEALTETPTEQPTDPPQTNINWTQAVYTVEDTAGYKYEITVKLSPWIFHTNTSLIDSAWNQVGNNNKMPRDFSDWGMKKQGNAYRIEALTDVVSGYRSYPYVAQMTDMYYSLGSISVNNVTDGWNITSSESRSLKFSIEYESSFYEVGTDVIGRLFYTSEIKDCSSGIYVSPKLTSDNWGPCSFVMMSPENKTPKNPDGDHYESLLNKDSYFHFFGGMGGIIQKNLRIDGTETTEYLRIGVIDKEGQYVAP